MPIVYGLSKSNSLSPLQHDASWMDVKQLNDEDVVGNLLRT